MPAKPAYDWLSICRDYVQGITIRNITTGENKHYFPKQEELSQKYNCPIQTIRIRSQKENWGLQRAQFKRKLRLKSSEVNLEDLLGVGVKFDSRHLSTLESVSILIDEFLKPHLELLNKPEELEMLEDLPKLTIRDLKDITTIVRDSHQTVKSILGEQNPQSLIEDIKEEALAQRRNREISRNRLGELSRQLIEAQSLKEELEMKRKEVEAELKEVQENKDKNKKKIG